MKNNDWLKEYEVFLNSESSDVPKAVTETVFARMKNLLAPSPWFVFLKILGIHAVVGSLSLSMCHQFGMNPFNTDASLSDWMMSMGGHHVCMIGCGIFFVGSTFALAGYFLSIEEVRVLRKTEFLQTSALGLFSLGLFSFFGAEIALSIAGLWLLGAFIGSFIATEAAWKFKRTHA